MKIKQNLNSLYRDVFIGMLPLIGIVELKYVFPINSVEELIELVITTIVVLMLSYTFGILIGKSISKTFLINKNDIYVKTLFHKYHSSLDEIKDFEYMKYKVLKSGRMTEELSFSIGKRKFTLHASEFKEGEFDCFKKLIGKDRIRTIKQY
jgi:hypothetical protein